MTDNTCSARDPDLVVDHGVRSALQTAVTVPFHPEAVLAVPGNDAREVL